MKFRDEWCAEFCDEVAIVEPTVARAYARHVAQQAHAINRTHDPREMAVVWLAWRKSGATDDVPPAPGPAAGEEDALSALFEHLGS